MVPYNKTTLFSTAQWIVTSKQRVGSKIRQLVETYVYFACYFQFFLRYLRHF